MAKTNITLYSSTPSSNTDINNINIDENCPASGLNNAIRELMAHLKNVDTGSQALTALSVTGNLLVGKTSADTTAVGIEARSVGLLVATRTSGQPIYANLRGVDGDIIGIAKDDAKIGSIGVLNSNNLTISSHTADHAGIQFGTHSITPMEANADADGTIDIGSANARFKDLYLSGGVYLGGTGSANYLDDYEEGTWTAEVRGATTRATTPVTGQAHYTKVGNKVTVRMYFVNANTTGASGTFQITGFPFSATSLQIIPFMSFGQDYDDTGGVMNIQLYLEGGTTAQLIATKDNAPWQATGITAGSGKYYAFTGTYLTS